MAEHPHHTAPAVDLNVDRKVYRAHNSAAIEGIGGTAVVIPVDAVDLDVYGVTTDATGISDIPPGHYEVEATVTFAGTGSTSRSSVECWLTNDGVEANGSRGKVYVRQSGFGGSADVSKVIDDPGEIAIMAQRVQGTATIEAIEHGTRLKITRLQT